MISAAWGLRPFRIENAQIAAPTAFVVQKNDMRLVDDGELCKGDAGRGVARTQCSKLLPSSVASSPPSGLAPHGAPRCPPP